MFSIEGHVYQTTLDRYKETSNINDRNRSDHPGSKWTIALVKVVTEELQRNTRRSMRQLAERH